MTNYIVADFVNNVICETDTLKEAEMFFDAYEKTENGYEVEYLTIYKVEKVEIGS